MSFLNMYNMMNDAHMGPDDHSSDAFSLNEPQPIPNWDESYDATRSMPRYYHVDEYLSPYPCGHWESGSPILNHLDDMSRLPALNDKVDPNKIFNSDITALRTLAADQARVLKVFEKRFLESMNDKNKYGLTEEDIMALQALTAARNAITAIDKEQVNIRKNIADLKIKQQTAGTRAVSSAGTGGESIDKNSMSSTDVGRSILDSIFETHGTVINTSAPTEYTSTSVDNAAALLDDIVSGPVSSEYESMGAKTYVVVGDNSNDASFATFDSNGSEIKDYPNVNAKITRVDLEAGIAEDEYLRTYPIKRLSDIQ